MKKLNASELRSAEGGASKYVKCPYCSYNSKSSLIERLFWSNARRQMYLAARHMRGGRYISGTAAHR